MAKFLNDHLKKVGVETQLTELGKHVMDGQELDLPPAILGRIGNDPKKKTVLILWSLRCPASECLVVIRLPSPIYIVGHFSLAITV
jgi:hypothetical protein